MRKVVLNKVAMNKFELLSRDDIAAVLRIEQAANNYPWTEAAFASSFADSYFSYKLLDNAGNILGFYIAQLILEQLELFNICVAPTEQGKGYGHALMQHFLHEGRTRGATEVFLEVRSSNLSAIVLYQRYGFTATGLRKGYYVSSAGKEDALLMCCIL
ncbi:ribosomal-protein-alanine N-acetyltransferase [Rheinheimera pacifica]|uniref:ribosomal protein S18-alanine N-acetyltransferase n=1 Tax=Rheinheimera pacifica TaxID=173990 RepID=UPI00285F5774|nr:ribosomal protein S18-alanine N-acetyltransferase [Rheinheimera pacifica]MDR6983825.1 ribosomal-protein-alanine N-acetyltransferase [Rheinheimera pacifica]